VVREDLPLRARLQQFLPKFRLQSSPEHRHRRRHASQALESLPVLLLGVLLLRLVLQSLLQLYQNVLPPCLCPLPLPSIPKKKSSVLVKRLSSSRRRNVLRGCVALKKKKKRKKHRGCVKRLFVCRENGKRESERQYKSVLSV
jgi:hypothetical protein